VSDSAGRRWFWPVAALLAAALVGQTLRARDLLEARRILSQVEQVSLQLASRGRAAAPIYWANVKLLQRAERLDPADSRLILARGSQFLLLGRPEAAATAYREALAVEPRPEIYLNLGRALAAAGDREAARRAFADAVALDPFLREEVPAELRPPKTPRR
jgi:tetratricopeptide (TPR) repeat protein